MITDQDRTTLIADFDPEAYPFHRVIAEFIGQDRLTELTSDYADGAAERGSNSLYKNMEQSPHFRRLYAALEGPRGAEFYDLYHRFVREVIRPAVGEPFYYQARPSHRILFADTPGVSRFHRDRDYGHLSVETNYQVVQTPARGNNAMWIESAEGQADYQPLELTVGQYARFKGADLEHGARRNDTGHSRVSFDFRIIRASQAPTDVTDPRSQDEDNPVRRNARNFAYCA